MSHMSERFDRMPESIAAILGDAAGKADGLGKSAAEVYLFDDYVLKVRPADGWDTVDTQILRWLKGNCRFRKWLHRKCGMDGTGC